jgi:sugar diacid utilization regulator
VRVDELLRAGGAIGVTLVAGPWDARAVEHVVIVDEPAEIERAPRGSVAILTRHASTRAAGYELDLVLRRAGDRELAAVALYGPATTSITAIRLADRSRVALLAVAADRELSELAFELENTLRSGADAMLRRVISTLAVVSESQEASLGAVLTAASDALGTAVRYGELPEGLTAVPVTVNGRPEGYVCAEPGDAATRVGCQLVADAVARIQLSLRASHQAATRARSEAIAEVLRAPEAGVRGAAERARLLDVPVDGRHAAIAIDAQPARDPAGPNVRAGEALLARARALVDEIEPDWHVMALDHTILMLRMVRPATAPVAPRAPLVVAEQVVRGVLGGRRMLALVCGVSGEHDGIDGLRAATAEARAALATARAEARINSPLSFDGSPFRRLLVELLSSQTARSSVDMLLAPLDQLGSRRARTAVGTLQVYLDERGSLTRAGERLHLHPNAVAYRIKQIRAQLDSDLEDPDQRLALQIACRARLMTADSSEPVARASRAPVTRT